MPTYAYACTACDHRFEAQQSFTDAALTECPECSGRLRKVFTNVGIVFKGSGFYRNDSRGGSGSGEKADGAAKGEPASGAKGDAAAAKSDSSPASSSGSSSSESSGASSSGSSSSKTGGSGSPSGSSSSGSSSSASSGSGKPAPSAA